MRIWHWMKPELVIQVAFADWTHGGILRQPPLSRHCAQDRDPKTVVREEPAHTEDVVKKRAGARSERRSGAKASREGEAAHASRRSQRLTHPDRVLFRTTASRKLQLAEYFAAVGEARDAALPGPTAVASCATRTARSRSSRSTSSSSRARGLRVVKIPNADKDPDFVVCDSPEGLLHLAQVGAVELHSWGAVMPKPTHADRLDASISIPAPSLPYPPLRDAALADPQAACRISASRAGSKTTGGKGLHVVVPLASTAARLGHREGIRAQRHAVHGTARAHDVHVEDRRAESQEQDLHRLSAQWFRRHRPSPRSRRAGGRASACRRPWRWDEIDERHPRHALQHSQRA